MWFTHLLFCWRDDWLQHRKADKTYLVCQQCGYRSPGWELDLPAPTVTQQAKRKLLIMKRVA